jgi:ABC-type branched-subunit amino acid transport system substrate-binding protein
LVGLAGKPTITFVKAVRQERKGLQLYALSIMGAVAPIRTLGADATGMTISQILPLPGNLSRSVVLDFQQAWKAANVTLEPSHLALEGMSTPAAPYGTQPHTQQFYRQHPGAPGTWIWAALP